MSVGDINGDGVPDIETADAGDFDTGVTGQVSALIGDGSGGFVATTTGYRSGTYAVQYGALADVNGDGLPDFAVAEEPSLEPGPSSIPSVSHCCGVVDPFAGRLRSSAASPLELLAQPPPLRIVVPVGQTGENASRWSPAE